MPSIATSSADTAPAPPHRRIVPVILAGGVGARLAPISTDARPKPFVPLTDGRSLLSHTLLRVANAARFHPPLLVGRAADRFALLNHARAAGVKPAAILLEPSPRNTALAVALATQWVAQHHGPDTCIAVLPADHHITPDRAWWASLDTAAQASQQTGNICLLAATPTHPDSGLGYLLLGPSSVQLPWQEVTRFVEKPDDANSLISGGARWNMGQCVATASCLQAALDRHAPMITVTARQAWAQVQHSWEFLVLPDWPDTKPLPSFDRAVLEHTASIAVPYRGQWRDLGTVVAWESFTGMPAAHYTAQPPRVDRPWGYFELLSSGAGFVEKRLVLYPGCRLSRQRHQQREEIWQVVQGIAWVERDEEIVRLTAGASITIAAQSWHRLANYYHEPIIILEKQIGECNELDIERAEDDYGRL